MKDEPDRARSAPTTGESKGHQLCGTPTLLGMSFSIVPSGNGQMRKANFRQQGYLPQLIALKYVDLLWPNIKPALPSTASRPQTARYPRLPLLRNAGEA